MLYLETFDGLLERFVSKQTPTRRSIHEAHTNPVSALWRLQSLFEPDGQKAEAHRSWYPPRSCLVLTVCKVGAFTITGDFMQVGILCRLLPGWMGLERLQALLDG
jgi:hypothetical protein